MKPFPFRLLATLAIGFSLGLISAFFALKPAVPEKWFILTPETPDIGAPKGSAVDVSGKVPVSYTNAVFIDSDIPAIGVKSISGKAKFISHALTVDGRCPIGYIIEVVAQPIDKAKLPEKYRKEKVIQTKGGPLTELPIEQATYEVDFTFHLLDRDGFELTAVQSKEHDIESGTTTEIQSQTEPMVSLKMASLTNSVAVDMLVKKCLTATQD
jgi:hypothetical protein